MRAGTLTARSSASTSSMRPKGRPGASACSSCEASKCRRTPGCRSRNSFAAMHGRALLPAAYRPAKLKRWGTELHDRFMLPWFVWQDFEDVIAETAAFGYPLEREWFAPHFEFRFPRYGSSRRAACRSTCALRSSPGTSWARKAAPALPCATWTRRSSGCRSRRAASSTLAMCWRPRRAAAADRQRRRIRREVRYRAWPPSALHPTIGVHAPLVFDLVDTWMNRSIGGCQYHVAHPGGLSYDTFPVNAYEAEGRRLTRFLHMGHTPRALEVRSEERNPNFLHARSAQGRRLAGPFFCYAARRCPGAPRRLPAGHRPLRRAARRPAFAARALAADDRAARGVAGRAHARAAALGAQPGARERRHLQACTPIRREPTAPGSSTSCR